MKQSWKIYLDWPLAAFVLVMLAAAAITSHGTYVFYSYILPWPLAIAATVVLTLGIPLLELAAVLDKASRNRYILGMLVLLGMEGMAQYMQAQAGFLLAVRAQFPDASGIDLATFAAQPRGRILPLLYLAALSGVVVYFGYAASARIRDLREGRVVSPEELLVLRDDLARSRAATENQTRTIADLRAVVAQHEQARSEQSTGTQIELIQARVDLRKEQETVAHQSRELEQLRQAVARASRPTFGMLLEVARSLLAEGKGLRSVADEIGVPESTLRGWMAKAAQNGHAVEV